MPSYQQLLRGALSQIAKHQSEMDELSAAARKEIELMQAAKSHFPPPEEPMRWYHGSPHTFDEFDFGNNLLKGEGALAFGPGGYLTGAEELARAYASKLSKNRGFVGHDAMREALLKDPEATAQYLRAVNMSKLSNAQPKLFEGVPFKEGYIPPGNYQVSRFTQREIQGQNMPEYLRAMEQAVPSRGLKMRIGRGGVSPDDAVRMGKEIGAATEDVQPLIKARRLPPVKVGEEMEVVAPWRRAGSEVLPANLALDPLRRNVNNTTRYIQGERDKPLSYSASMQRRFNFNDPESYAAKRARNLYEAQVNLKPGEMLPYDYPVSVADPKLMGALSQLADQLTARMNPTRVAELEWARKQRMNDEQLRGYMRGRGFPVVDPEKTTGKDVIHQWLRNSGLSNREQMELMKQSGIPAMYFERAGRRGEGALPDTFNPDKYNFVVFDEDVLGKPTRTPFSQGGRV